MENNKSTIFWIGGILIIAVGFLIYPRLFSKNNSVSTTVPCLTPNLPLVQHIHPRLKILVEDREEKIPANIGLTECERAIHTHNEDAADGVIHVESQIRREYALGDFFSVWGRPIERDGYRVKVTADGELVENPVYLVLKDLQQIVVEYSSNPIASPVVR